MPGEGAQRILVVDDERGMREFLEILLAREGYRVSLAVSGKEAFHLLEEERYDLVISDIRLPDHDGIDVLKKAKTTHPDTTVVMISAFASAESAVEAMREGAYDYIPKPFKVREFKKIVRESLLAKESGASGKDAPEEKEQLHFGCLVGESPQMKKVYDLVDRVARTKTNILVFGESGTGKELVARAIHRQSARRDNPFVVINCAGIPESLIESELFGYRKGAFTGASTDKLGLFDAAHGGTVFFDEIGELPPTIQVKLLRVIQERTFTAVGGTEEKSVDVRFISATNKDLETEVIENRFREDLYFRLNVIQISMPPLRDREGDLPLLAQRFLEKYSAELGKDVKKISAYALDILQQVGLEDRSASYPDRLSGGQQQRVAICRALIHNPLVLLADEPTGNLDAESGRGVLALLDQLIRQNRMTALMVTHSVEVARLADRVITIKDGGLVETAASTEAER